MKKINFFQVTDLSGITLVKGCPTDINGDGNDSNDDYNHDGDVDQYDQAFYDGYHDGYNNDNQDTWGWDQDVAEAYWEGATQGYTDWANDVSGQISGDNYNEGPDIDIPNMYLDGNYGG